jgi:hypothetical protein
LYRNVAFLFEVGPTREHALRFKVGPGLACRIPVAWKLPYLHVYCLDNVNKIIYLIIAWELHTCPHHAQPKPKKSMASQDCTAEHFCSFSGKLLITSRGAPVDSLLVLEFELTKQHPAVIFFPFDPSVPSSPRSGLPISYAMATRKLLNLEIIYIYLDMKKF